MSECACTSRALLKFAPDKRSAHVYHLLSRTTAHRFVTNYQTQSRDAREQIQSCTLHMHRSTYMSCIRDPPYSSYPPSHSRHVQPRAISADSLLSLSAPALTAQQAQLHPPIANRNVRAHPAPAWPSLQMVPPRMLPSMSTARNSTNKHAAEQASRADLFRPVLCARGRTAAPRCRCHACGARPTSSAPNGGHASPGHARR